MRTKRITAATLLLLAGVTLFGCNSRLGQDEDDKPQAPAHSSVAADGSIHLTPDEVRAIGIQTVTVAEQAIPTTVDAVGRIIPRAGSRADVFPPFPGRLILDSDTARVPRIGSFIAKGQVIGEVEQLLGIAETTQVRANIAQLEANLQQARQEVAYRQTDYQRASQLYESGGFALKKLQTAELALKQAKAQLEGAERAKAVYQAAESQQSSGPRRVPVTAPIAGTVVSTDLTSGEMTDPSKNLLTIIDLSKVWVEVPVHESDLPSVRAAKQAVILTPANPGRSYLAKVVTIGSVLDPLNRTVEVVLSIDNRDLSLKVGMTANARIPSGKTTTGTLVPESAVLLGEGQPVVYVEIQPGVYKSRRVSIGQRTVGEIEVTAGLSSGEKVVSTGAQALLGEASKGQLPTSDD